MVPLRVHIAVLGYLGDRIYAPLEEMRAEKLYLLRLRNEQQEAALKALEAVQNKVKERGIEIQEVECDIFQVTEIVKTVRRIMEDEKNNDLYLNFSSGNTLSSNAFTIAFMLHKSSVYSAKLYYVKYDHDRQCVKEGDSSKIIDLPAFGLDCPLIPEQRVLKLANQERDGATKKQLLQHLSEYHEEFQKGSRSQRLMKMNRQVIDKLVQRNMITVEGRSKSSRVKLKDEGAKFVQFI